MASEWPNMADVESALKTEVSSPPKLTPWRAVENVVTGNEPELAPHVRGAVRRSLQEAPPVETYFAWKDRRSLRPLHHFPFASRIALRTSTSQVRGELVPDLDRSFEAYRSFEDDIDPAASYVVQCDVHAFYQHVSHSKLQQEIVSLTGETGIASRTVELLGLVQPKDFGLPQLHAASDLLSEIYIAAPTREFVRAGFRVARYNDDFRISVNSYSEARTAIELLTSVLERWHLTLNPSKTMILKRETYDTWRKRPEQLKTEIAEQNSVDPDAADMFFGGMYHDPVDNDLFTDATKRESARLAAYGGLSLWHKERSTPTTKLRGRINLGIARSALEVLGAMVEPADADKVADLWHQEPHASDSIGRYLARIARHHESEFNETIQMIFAGQRWSNPWQSHWLLYALAERCSSEAEEWVRTQSRSTSGSVRAAAVLVLANNALVDLGQVAEAYNRAGDQDRPLLAAAASRSAENSKARKLGAIRGDGEVIKLILEANEDALAVL